MPAVPIRAHHIRAVIKRALKEDIPYRDVTTHALILSSFPARARLIAQEPMRLAGLAVASQVFREADSTLRVKESYRDGDTVKAQSVLLTIEGDARSILKSERVALNFLQHLSGIATLTARFCHAVRGYQTKILDTRKTIPGLRVLQKWAVTLGGGCNHRHSLSDGILIKDNHLAVLRAQGVGLATACELARKQGSRRLTVCVEAETLGQVKEALRGHPDVILLDNMTPAMVKKAVRLINNRTLVEVSGGVNFDNVRKMAAAGADFISIGALTHSVRAINISLALSPMSRQVRRSPR